MAKGVPGSGQNPATGQLGGQDGHLPSALTRLHDAIAALCDPVMEIVDGRRHYCDSWYTQLLDSLPGNQGEGGGGTPNLGGCWIDCLLIVVEIDDAVACWQPDGTDTPDRLALLAARKWRPQDVRSLDQISDNVRAWVKDIQGLLHPAPKLTPRVPCPDCGERWTYEHDSGGELVRRPALRVTAEGCRCGRCRTLWPPDSYGLLTRRIKDECHVGDSA